MFKIYHCASEFVKFNFSIGFANLLKKFYRCSHNINICSNSVESQRLFLTEFYREFSVSAVTHQPPGNSSDTEYPMKRLKLIPSEHSKTHNTDTVHSTHRQDIGKVSWLGFTLFCVYLKVSKTYKVLILPISRSLRPFHQQKQMAMKYMNRFAIEEDDQFEIHVKDYTDEKDSYKAAEEVMLKAQQGLGL